MSTLRGCDVSYWQGAINYAQMYQEGLRFAYCRLGIGTHYKDPTAVNNVAGFKAAGFAVGVYHVYYPSTDPIKQANWLLDNLPLGTNLPPAVDLEITSGIPYQYADKIKAYLDKIENELDKKPIIYTAFYYWRDTVKAPFWGKDYKLWVANYDYKAPMIPKPWFPSDYFIWQFTDKGEGINYGVSSKQLDLNIMRV